VRSEGSACGRSGPRGGGRVPSWQAAARHEEQDWRRSRRALPRSGRAGHVPGTRSKLANVVALCDRRAKRRSKTCERVRHGPVPGTGRGGRTAAGGRHSHINHEAAGSCRPASGRRVVVGQDPGTRQPRPTGAVGSNPLERSRRFVDTYPLGQLDPGKAVKLHTGT